MKFRSPHDDSEMTLTPEYSTEIQNTIGADIIMQLDDVVHSTTTGPRVEEAMWRTVSKERGGGEGVKGRRGEGKEGRGGKERVGGEGVKGRGEGYLTTTNHWCTNVL